jgi:hypothetical protein
VLGGPLLAAEIGSYWWGTFIVGIFGLGMRNRTVPIHLQCRGKRSATTVHVAGERSRKVFHGNTDKHTSVHQ